MHRQIIRIVVAVAICILIIDIDVTILRIHIYDLLSCWIYFPYESCSTVVLDREPLYALIMNFLGTGICYLVSLTQ